MNNYKNIKSILEKAPKNLTLKNFYKTGQGQYAEHDKFNNVSVPILRKISKEFRYLSLNELENFIHSEINEERLLAIFILILQFQKDPNKIYDYYMKNIDYINNWNLVDSSAYHILGCYIYDKDQKILFNLAQSNNMWHRRIAIISTLYFIRKKDIDIVFKIATILLHDTHDLIHKATGWMLREVGKVDQEQLIDFLKLHIHHMPQIMLRYATEKIGLKQIIL